MISSMLYASLLLGALTACSAYSTSYEGYQQWHVTNITQNQIDDIRGIIKTNSLDVLGSGKSSVEFIVEPHRQKILHETLSSKHFHYEVTIENLQSLIDEELKHRREKAPTVGIDFSDFNDLETIEAYIKEVADEYDWVSVESIGQTVEGRDLWAMTLAIAGAEPKPIIYIDCGIHAREWVSHATCVYGLDYLTKGYSTVEEVTSLLDKYDLILLPVYNPDGYVFSWDEDRAWRKNRGETDLPECPGVDLNRNVEEEHWDGPYSSDFACDLNYRGLSVYSEKESQIVSEYIKSLAPKMTAYINIHTFRESWLYPYGFTEDLPPNHEDLDRVAKIAVEAQAEVHGKLYIYGPVYTTIYPINGDLLDWVYMLGVPYSFAIEMRGPSFIVPATEIIPTAEETWAGIIALVLAI